MEKLAATFGWLCVETISSDLLAQDKSAAAFARLCVETPILRPVATVSSAAAFARLFCIETIVALCKTVLVNSQFLYGGVERLVSVCVL